MNDVPKVKKQNTGVNRRDWDYFIKVKELPKGTGREEAFLFHPNPTRILVL